jgi:hypothetical protein
MLFAMFGRGLVLQPMFGPELNPETVEFVVTGILNAPCTCVARDQLMAMTQPILLDFDWDKKPDEPAEDDAIVGAMPVPHFGPLWAGTVALVPTGVPMAPVAVCAAERSGPFFAHLRSRGPGISTGVRNTGRSVVAGLSDAIVAGGGPVTAPQETAPSGGRSIVVSVLTVLAVLAVVVFLGTFIIMTRKYTA